MKYVFCIPLIVLSLQILECILSLLFILAMFQVLGRLMGLGATY